jgi:hypothetical protein
MSLLHSLLKQMNKRLLKECTDMKSLYYLRDFSGGINVQDAPNLIPETALTEAQNAVIGKGSISKRSGYEVHALGNVERVVTWGDIGGKKWGEL